MSQEPMDPLSGLDPYEEARRQEAEEAKLVVPAPAKKNRKILIVGMVVVGVIVAMVAIANIAKLFFASAPTQQQAAAERPTTMTPRQSKSFADQQGGEARYMKGVDGRNKQVNAEDTVLGHGAKTATDANDEADGVTPRTAAQDREIREGGHRTAPEKSEARLRAEKAALETAHRKQNDLDSSPVSVDFSDYFAKENQTVSKVDVKGDPIESNTEAQLQAERRRTLREEDPRNQGDDEETGAKPKEVSARKGMDHDPKQDYEWDNSYGKLYRLMEDTIIETVLVNRLAGASIGPAITMVTTDVYSLSGGHLLIPKGTRLLGTVSAVGSTGQERLFVAFHRMVMPDGYSVSLDKFKALDVVGQTGLRDLVNHHYVQIFGASLALAAVAAVTQVGNAGASYGSYDFGVSMRNGASQGLGQSAQRVMERFLNILPTFTIRERARVKVMLSNDMTLPDIKNHQVDPDL